MLLGQQKGLCTSSLHALHPPPFLLAAPSPWAVANGSYKGNWESLYMRLLLVLAAIYGSTGSSDVGRRAEGEHAVSSKAIQCLATLKPFFLFTATKLRLGSSPPMWATAVMRLLLHGFKWLRVSEYSFFSGGGGTSCLVHLANAKLCYHQLTIKITPVSLNKDTSSKKKPSGGTWGHLHTLYKNWCYLLLMLVGCEAL